MRGSPSLYVGGRWETYAWPQSCLCGSTVLKHKEKAGPVVRHSVTKHLQPVAEKCHIHQLSARAFTHPPSMARRDRGQRGGETDGETDGGQRKRDRYWGTAKLKWNVRSDSYMSQTRLFESKSRNLENRREMSLFQRWKGVCAHHIPTVSCRNSTQAAFSAINASHLDDAFSL